MPNLNTTIHFDMDGTLADLFAVDHWVDRLRKEDITPYLEAKPLLKLNLLARQLHKLQKKGYKIGVISWLSMGASDRYNAEVEIAKREWLAEHLPSVQWDSLVIVPYGTPKENYGTPNDILFDDDIRNRENWIGTAYDVDDILGVLKRL